MDLPVHVPQVALHGRRVCLLPVGESSDEIPHAALGLTPTHGIRRLIALYFCNETCRIVGLCVTEIESGLPCERLPIHGDRVIEIGVLEDLAPLRGHIGPTIARVREYNTRDPFDTIGSLVDEQLDTLR